MRKLKKSTSVLLIFLLCMSVLIGCTNTGEGDSTLSPYFTESETSAPPPAPTLRDYIDALIPANEGKRFELADVRRLNRSEGRTMTVLCWDSPLLEFENTSDTEEYTLADRRRDALASDLGVTLTLEHRAGRRADVQSFVDYACAVDGAGKSRFDVIAAYSKAASVLAQKGLLSSLSSGKITVDTEREWYPEGIKDSLSFGDDLYFVTGDISPTTLTAAELFFFDVEEAEARGVDVDALYESVFEGEWTLDAMFDLLAGADLPAQEETGDAETTDGTDTGIPTVTDPIIYRLTVSRTGLASLYFCAGLSIAENVRDTETGNMTLVFSPDYTGGTSSVLHARLISALTGGEMRVPSVTGQNFFGDHADSVAWIGDLASAMAAGRELGVLPLPKLTKDADYVGVASDMVTYYGVPASLDEDRYDLAVIFIEQAGYLSSQMTEDTYRTCLRSFSESYEIENRTTLELHRRTLSFDLGAVAAGTDKLPLNAADGWASLIIGRNQWELYSETIAVSLSEQIDSLNKRQ